MYPPRPSESTHHVDETGSALPRGIEALTIRNASDRWLGIALEPFGDNLSLEAGSECRLSFEGYRPGMVVRSLRIEVDGGEHAWISLKPGGDIGFLATVEGRDQWTTLFRDGFPVAITTDVIEVSNVGARRVMVRGGPAGDEQELAPSDVSTVDSRLPPADRCEVCIVWHGDRLVFEAGSPR